MRLSVTFYIALVLFLSGCASMVVTSANQSNATYQDQNFSDAIGIVQFFPLDGRNSSDPIMQVGQRLELHFDLLEDEYSYLNAKVIHCNFDWKKSDLPELEYLSITNEFQIEDFAYSVNTRVPYVTYKWVTPPIRTSGNYMIIIYKDNDINKPVLSRRFVVYKNDVAINLDINYSDVVSRRRTHHQVTFDVTHTNLQLFNPQAQLKAIVLQNHNWKNAISDLQPTLVRPDRSYLEYRLYNGANEFSAGNEFRIADIRATQFRGLNVERITSGREYFNIYLASDKPRYSIAYTNLFEDSEGNFSISNSNPDESLVQSDYVLTHFALKSDPKWSAVFVEGKFNNWNAREQHRMIYNTQEKQYEGSFLLKQGTYNYQYVIESSRTAIEGSFVETGNDYEVLLYYRDPGRNVDEVIGYAKASSRN